MKEIVEVEKAANLGNMRELYTTIRKLSGKYGKPERPLKDKEGREIMEEEGGTDGWSTLSF
jgi:hypothetical protein